VFSDIAVRMLDAIDNANPVLSLYNICCPQPRRTAASPCAVRKHKTKHVLSMVEKELFDACEEIRNILGGSRSIESSLASPFKNVASLGELSNTHIDTNSPSQVEPGQLFTNNGEPERTPTTVTEVPHWRQGKSDDTPELERARTHRLSKFSVRPQLTDSVPVLPALNLSLELATSSPATSTTSHVTVPVPAQTPPLRSQNPLPFNSPFSSKQAREGIEFGLLSVSPLLVDDEDIFVRFENARVRRTMRHYYNDSGDGNYERSSSSNSGNYDSNDTTNFSETGNTEYNFWIV